MAAETDQRSADDLLAEDMARFFDDPLGFVMYAYPWDTDPSIQVVELPEPWRSRYGCRWGPDEWACGFLEEVGEKVRERGFDGMSAVDPQLHGISSGHGIGKSAMVGWLCDWIMSTRPYCRGTVTANTGPQLSSKTWPNVVKWTRKCITGHWFMVTTGIGSMRMVHKDHPEDWRVDAQTCREENAEAFAGQHAVNSTSFYIFDEASAIPDAIWETAEGGLTDGEPMWFAFGNPTRNVGRFATLFRKLRHRWTTRTVDSREVQITNKGQIQKWIDDWGEDSDFVRVRVKGKFPRASSMQLIPTDLIEAARKREPVVQLEEPLICSIDVAREGDDDSVIRLRQGKDSQTYERLRLHGADGDTIAEKVSALHSKYYAKDRKGIDAIFVDATGGWGWAVIDALRRLGFTPVPVAFSGKADDPQYLNKRAEMAFRCRQWLQEGGCIQDDQALEDELVAIEYGHPKGKRDALALIPKEDIKKDIGISPDDADSLFLSFAQDVPRRDAVAAGGRNVEQVRRTFDPFS